MNQRMPDRFDALHPVKPPPELRRRAMAAALDTLRSPVRQDAWTRIARSRGLRLAWAAAIVLLILGHFALSLRPDRPGPRPDVLTRIASSADPEVSSVVQLVRIKTSPDIDALLGIGESPGTRVSPGGATGEENGS